MGAKHNNNINKLNPSAKTIYCRFILRPVLTSNQAQLNMTSQNSGFVYDELTCI